MLRRVALLSAVVGSVTAQSSTSSAPQATHTVKVGFPVGQHKFEPEQTTAEVGDTILFEFYPKEHSAVYMHPSNPCIPYDYTNPTGLTVQTMWWSEFRPIRDNWAEEPTKARTYTIEVKTSDPIYFYCSAKTSCESYGMVGVINPENSTVLATVQEAAKAKTYELSPGDPIPSEEETALGGGTQSPVPSGTTTPANTASTQHGLSPGAIAGIVIGAIGAFALVGLLFFLVGRKKKAAEAAAPAAVTTPPKAPQDMEQHVGLEHPPMYQSDPRYSMVAPGSPTPWTIAPTHTGESMAKVGHQSMLGENFDERHPHRLSELASQNYDPVEIYTPDLSTHNEGNTPTSPRPPHH